MSNPEASFYITAEDQTAAAFRSADKNLQQFQSTARSVRGLLASFGVVFSARAFAGWINGALEAKDMTEAQLEATKEARDALASMKSASEDLARSLGTELVPAMKAVGAVLTGWNRIFTGADPFPFQQQIDRLEATVENSRQRFRVGDMGLDLDEFNRQINELIELKRKQRVALGLETDPNQSFFKGETLSQDEWVRLESQLYDMNNQKAKDVKQTLSPALDTFIDQLKEAANMTADLRTETERNLDAWRDAKLLFESGVIDESTLNKFGDTLLEPIEVTAKRLQELKVQTEDETAQWAMSLGKGLESAFAGWLSGAETNFRDFLKRMAAEFIASQLFTGIAKFAGGPSTFLGKLFGGFRAEGGPVVPGRAYVVGENAPELFIPGMSGQIVPAAAGAPVYITNTIDARGADEGLARRLPAILEANNRKVKAEIQDLKNRGRF